MSIALKASAFSSSACKASQGTIILIMPYNLFLLQPGTYDLVGTIIYELDDRPFQSTFFNGTVEVVESGAFLSMESVFLVTLGTALLILLVLWIHGQIQNLSKVLKSLYFFQIMCYQGLPSLLEFANSFLSPHSLS